MNKTIIQIGSHIGNTVNDPIFNSVNNNTILILVEPVPYLFNILKNNYKSKFVDNQNIFCGDALFCKLKLTLVNVISSSVIIKNCALGSFWALK